MKKTARVIITSKCDRKCPGCCNIKLDYTSLAKVIGGITAVFVVGLIVFLIYKNRKKSK